MPTKTQDKRDAELQARFREIEEKYTEDGVVMLGNASPDELRELGKLNRELLELRAKEPEEATA